MWHLNIKHVLERESSERSRHVLYQIWLRMDYVTMLVGKVLEFCHGVTKLKMWHSKLQTLDKDDDYSYHFYSRSNYITA